MKYLLFIVTAIFFSNTSAQLLDKTLVEAFDSKPIESYTGYCGIKNGKKTEIIDKNCGLIYNTLGISKYFMDINDKQIIEEVTIVGDDLTNHNSNVQFVASALINLSIKSATNSDDRKKLKEYILKITSENAFTKLRRHSFKNASLINISGFKIFGYPPYAESKYRSYGMILAVLSGLPLIIDELSEEEIKSIQKWGTKLINNNHNIEDGIKYNSSSGVPDSADRVSINASAEILWGLTFSDKAIVASGVSLYQKFIDGIKSNGAYDSAFMSYKGQQLRYLHHAYGGLVIGASYLKSNGIDAYKTRGRLGGDFKTALEYFTVRLFDTKSRIDIGEKQNTYFEKTNRTHIKTTDYFKLIYNDDVFDENSSGKTFLINYLKTIDEE
jgi:hypothetical protein